MGELEDEAKTCTKKYFIHYAMRITRTREFVPQPALALSQFSLEKRTCIQEILPFENSRIYTFENLMRVWGNFHCQFSQFTTQPRKRTKRTCTTRRKNRAGKKGITLLSELPPNASYHRVLFYKIKSVAMHYSLIFITQKKYPLGQISFITIMTILSEFIRV